MKDIEFTVNNLILWGYSYNRVQDMYNWGMIKQDDYEAYMGIWEALHGTHWTIRYQELSDLEWDMSKWIRGYESNIPTLVDLWQKGNVVAGEWLSFLGIKVIRFTGGIYRFMPADKTFAGILTKQNDKQGIDYLFESPEIGEYGLRNGEFEVLNETI